MHNIESNTLIGLLEKFLALEAENEILHAEIDRLNDMTISVCINAIHAIRTN